MGNLYLIRSGESVADVDNKINGTLNFNLSLNGIEQVYKLCEPLSTINFNKVYCSKITRAMDTTDIIIKNIQKMKSQFIKDYNLKYENWLAARDHSFCNGKTIHELTNLFPDEINNTLNQDIDIHYPGGESLRDVYNRVIPEFYNEIYKNLQNSNESVLIVSHEAVLQSIMTFLHKKTVTHIPNVNAKPATMYHFLIA